MKKRIVEGRWGAGRGGKSEGKREKTSVCAHERENVCVIAREVRRSVLSSAQGKSSAQAKGKPSTALLQLVEVACGSVPL